MKKYFLFSLIFLIGTATVFSQTGKIRGTVIEDATGLPLIGCSVVIEGTTTGGITDFDGNYSISVAPGTYTIVCSYVSFATQKISDVVVKEGEVTVVKLRMKDQAITGETFELTAKQIRNNEAAIATIKKKSVNLVDGISAQTFKKNGDNTAASALQRVTGVSVQGGKEVYVRGLGDRYSKTILNGISIPGLDPDKNSVQVDIFPSNVIDNMVVYKSFSPDLPGDFTGGMVDIVTKDFPETRVLGATISLGYNPAMNFKSDFLTYDGSSLDGFAMGADDRKLPVSKKFKAPILFINDRDDQILERVTKSFSPEMSVKEGSNLLNERFSFSLGNQHEREKTTYGYTFTLGYNRTYKAYDDITFNRYEKDSDKSVYQLALLDADTGAMGTESVLWNTLISGSIKRKVSKYTITLFHTQNGIKTGSRLKQTSSGISSTPGAILDKSILYYNERSISNVLLASKHVFNKKLELKTAISPSLAKNKEPDLRQTFFTIEDDGRYTLNYGDGALINRTWRNLEEINANAKVDLKWTFNSWNGLASDLKVGAYYLYKQRDFDVVQYYFRDIVSHDYSGEPDDLFTSANLFNTQTSESTLQGIYVNGQIDSSNIYSSNIAITSGYIMNELPVDSSLKLTYGVRIEKSLMEYTGQRQSASAPEDYFDNTVVLDELDVLPAFSLVYNITKDINLRGSYTRTLARPSFKEKSGAQIYDPVTQLTFIGNLDLVETKINNYDLRLEKFMGSVDIISVSGFYKDFNNPIELVAYSQVSPDNITPRNVGKATVIGVEFELRKNLEFVTPTLKNISVGGNVTYAKSEVEMNDAEYEGRVYAARDGESIEKTRPFQGQAPFMINSFVSFSHFEKGIDVNLSYNVQGKSLAVVGISSVPDVYNKPYHNMSFKASKYLGEKKMHQVSFTVRNILGSKRERVYSSFQADDVLFSSFNENRTFSISYSFSLK